MEKLKRLPIPDMTILNWRGKVAYVMECVNPKASKNQQFRYYVDSGGWRWSVLESELREFNKQNLLFITSGDYTVNLK